MENVEIRLVNSMMVNNAKYGLHNVPAPIANTIMALNDANEFINSLSPKSHFTLPDPSYNDEYSLLCAPIKVFNIENNRLKRVELVVRTIGPVKIKDMHGRKVKNISDI